MKKILVSLGLLSAMVYANNAHIVLDTNEKLFQINKSIDGKIEILKTEIVDYKKKKSIQLKRDIESEKIDYDNVVKSFNFFKLKHKKNVYAQDKIKNNDEQLIIINKNHLDYKQRTSVKIEQLGHSDFIPVGMKEIQEEIFFFEIKGEEFQEMYVVNKNRYENTMKLAIERFKSDSKTLIDEFQGIKYNKSK